MINIYRLFAAILIGTTGLVSLCDAASYQTRAPKNFMDAHVKIVNGTHQQLILEVVLENARDYDSAIKDLTWNAHRYTNLPIRLILVNRSFISFWEILKFATPSKTSSLSPEEEANKKKFEQLKELLSKVTEIEIIEDQAFYHTEYDAQIFQQFFDTLCQAKRSTSAGRPLTSFTASIQKDTKTLELIANNLQQLSNLKTLKTLRFVNNDFGNQGDEIVNMLAPAIAKFRDTLENLNFSNNAGLKESGFKALTAYLPCLCHLKEFIVGGGEERLNQQSIEALTLGVLVSPTFETIDLGLLPGNVDASIEAFIKKWHLHKSITAKDSHVLLKKGSTDTNSDVLPGLPLFKTLPPGIQGLIGDFDGFDSGLSDDPEWHISPPTSIRWNGYADIQTTLIKPLAAAHHNVDLTIDGDLRDWTPLLPYAKKIRSFKFDLTNNPLPSFFDFIKGLSPENLREIDFRGSFHAIERNNIIFVRDFIKHLAPFTGLEVLRLRSCGLGYFNYEEPNVLTTLLPLLKNLEILDFSDNLLGFPNAKTIVTALESASKLRELNLSNNYIGHDDFKDNWTDIISPLAHLKNLKILNLASNAAHNKENGLESIAQLTSLEDLDLSKDSLKWGDQKFIDALSKLTNLKRLNISRTELRPNNVNNLSIIFKALSNTLEDLNLSNNHLSDVSHEQPMEIETAEALNNALLELNNLHNLDLSDMGLKTVKNINALTPALEHLTKTLQILKIGYLEEKGKELVQKILGDAFKKEKYSGTWTHVQSDPTPPKAAEKPRQEDGQEKPTPSQSQNQQQHPLSLDEVRD